MTALRFIQFNLDSPQASQLGSGLQGG